MIAAAIGEASSVHLISRRCRSLSETRHRRQLPLKGKPAHDRDIAQKGMLMIGWKCRGRSTLKAFPLSGKRPSLVDGNEVEGCDIIAAGMGEASSVYLIRFP